MDSKPIPITTSGLVRYPFPLRPGLEIVLYLPARLTRADVARISAMLDTLTLEAGQALEEDAALEAVHKAAALEVDAKEALERARR